MTQINSLSSFQYEYADPTLEFPFNLDSAPVLLPIESPSTDALVEQSPASISEQMGRQTQSLTAPNAARSMVTQLQDVPTTQSLIAALQSTMTPTVTRTPVVIPGTMKRAQASRQATSVRRISPRLRLAIILGVFIVIVITALLSLTPLGGGQGSLTLFSSAYGWIQTQQQSEGITGHVVVTLAQDNPVSPPTTTNTTTTTNLPPLTLSTSAYVNIARQDAIAAGINPDFFVRQIQVESGFNPVAASGAGAVGIAQFLPSTAAGLGINPYDPISALAGAARYMASFAHQYGGDYAKALAAYNGGSGTLQYAVAAGGANWRNFLPAETKQYILRIMGY